MGPLDILNGFLEVYGVMQAGKELLKALDRRGALEGAKDAMVDVRMKARGHLWPVIIERLDDGTDPQHQHLSLDWALWGLEYPEERIQKALHYWSSQSFENIVAAFSAAIEAQALRGAQEGEERTGIVILDIFGGIRQTATVRFHAAGGWTTIARRKDYLWKQMWAKVQAERLVREQQDREAKEKRRAAKSWQERARFAPPAG
jgi:hypothetical protein